MDHAQKVIIVMAMEAEAAPLCSTLGAQPLGKPDWAAGLPCRILRAEPTSTRPEVILAVNGADPITGMDCIGTTAAALTTQVALNVPEAADADLLLSIGTAGGWTRGGATIGDVFVAWPRFVCHDRRVALPGFDALTRANLDAADLRAHANAIGCRLGMITTGDSLDESATDREIILRSGGEVKEMEAAAVAWIGHLHDVPVSAVKAITDIVDSPVATADQFTANLGFAVSALHDKTIALLERLGTDKP